VPVRTQLSGSFGVIAIVGALCTLSIGALSGCSSAGPGDLGVAEDGLAIESGHCALSGSGVLPPGDSFVGSVHDEGGTPTGSWSHTTSTLDVLEGIPTTLLCRVNGSTVANVGGTATWNGEPGYTFQLQVQDRGVASPPERVLGAVETQTLVASREYSPTVWNDGELAFPEGALVTIPETLPVTVGNAGNQWARLTFVDYETGDEIRCDYRGGAQGNNPRTAEGIAAGGEYRLVRCRALDDGRCSDDSDLDPGDVIEVSSVHLRVHHGSGIYPSRDAALTEVSVDLTVQPYELVSIGVTDFYLIRVIDPTGAFIYQNSGDLILGDTTVTLL
jgi:hypothetical protein